MAGRRSGDFRNTWVAVERLPVPEPSTARVTSHDRSSSSNAESRGTRTAMLGAVGLGLLGVAWVAVDLHQALDAQRRGLAHELRVGPEKRAKGFAKTNSKKSKV